MTDNFTYALVDDGEIIRKYRWSNKEAQWYKETHPHTEIIKLKINPKTKFNLNDYPEALY